MSNYMCEQVYTLKTSLRDLVLLKKKAQRVVHKSGVIGWEKGTRCLYLFCFLFLTGSIAALGSPGGSAVGNPSANAGHAGSIPASGRSPGGGNGNPLQYSCAENSMDRGAWRATVHGVTKSQI